MYEKIPPGRQIYPRIYISKHSPIYTKVISYIYETASVYIGKCVSYIYEKGRTGSY